MSNAPVLKSFKRRRILVAIFIGCSLSAYMLYRNFAHIEFREVPKGTGTHRWVDSNHNGIIDFQIPIEFRKQPKGNFKKQTARDVLTTIEWTPSTWFWLGMAIIGMIGRDLAYMWRMRILTKKELSWKKSFNVILLWEFASALAPGVVSGATVAMFILNREKINMGRSTAIVIITAFFDNLFYILFIPLVFIIISNQHLFPANTHNSSTVSSVFWTGYAIFAALCFALFLSLFIFPNFIKHILLGITRLPLFRKWNSNALRVGTEIADTAYLMKSEKPTYWFTTFFATICSWTSRFLVINFIVQAFIPLSWQNHFLVLGKQFILWMFLRVSPTPGGSGVAEWAFSELLSSFSTSLLLLGGMAVLWRLISYVPYLLIGAFLLPRWLKNHDSEGTMEGKKH